MKDSRRPLIVDIFGNIMNKRERATVLSIESQFRSLFVIIAAPVFGYMADTLGISGAFLIIGIFMTILSLFIKVKDIKI